MPENTVPNNITAANASITVADAIGTANLEGFSADSALSSELVRITETALGVDGILSAGYVPAVKAMQIDFAASSRSISHLMALGQLAVASKTPMAVIMTITVPAVSMKFVCNGFLTEVPPVIPIGRTLGTVSFRFEFNEITPMPM